MENWYSTKLEKDVRVVLSDSGYTNKEISLILLDHIALHTNAGLDKRPKVLLIWRNAKIREAEREKEEDLEAQIINREAGEGSSYAEAGSPTESQKGRSEALLCTYSQFGDRGVDNQ
jgi:hypothetical protein